MSHTNPAQASAPQGEFKVTLNIKIPGSLVKDWEIPAETLSAQSTVDEVLVWIKSHIIKRLKETSYIDIADFTGFMKRLGENVQDPSICFATSVSPVINEKLLHAINLDDEHAKRFNTIRDLFIDPTQLGGSTRLDFKVVLNICPQPPGVPPATDASMLDNFVHPRRQNTKYIAVGTVQDGLVGKYGAMQSTQKKKAAQAAHKNLVLARFYPLKPDKFSGIFHTVPKWYFNDFSGGIGDPDASIEWSFDELLGKGTYLWKDFMSGKTLDLVAVEAERQRQDGLTTVQSRNNDTEYNKDFHPPERPYMTFQRPDLTGFGNPPGVSFNAAVKLHAVIQVFYHFNKAPLDQNHVPRNMQLPVVGTMSVQALEVAMFTAGRQKGQQPEDMIISKYRNAHPAPFCEWWVMPKSQTTRLLHRIEDKSVHVAGFIPNAANATENMRLYMECHIWDDPKMALDGW